MAAIGKTAAIGEEVHSSRQLQLSDLPDEILIRILSLLPTETAVWTCLLVLRRSGQHHLWKSLPSLEFHAGTTMFALKSNFINFVDRVMYLRDDSEPLVSFSLQHCMEEDEYTEYHIDTWITKAVRCNVEDLTLESFSYMEAEMPCLPSCLFGCQSLVKLDIDGVIFDVPSSVVCLPRLKYLRLSDVVLTGDNSTKKLLSSPLLEELIIDSCHWMLRAGIRVSSPKLQVLKIINDDRYGFCGKIRIIGDNLKYFSYMGNLTNEYRICASSTQLSKVEIYVNEQMRKKYALNCYNILKGLSGTRNLGLSEYFLKGLQNSSELLDTIPVFEDLTRLHIRVYNRMLRIDSLVLMKIYERCPHLTYLDIGKLSQIVRSPQLNPIPLCFQTHLKKITIDSYVSGDEEDDAAIDVLLKSALVLEELVIYCKRDEEKGFHEGGRKIQELEDRLNRRSRASKDCIISVSIC